MVLSPHPHPLSLLHGATPTSMSVSSKGGSLIPLPMSQETFHGGIGQEERESSMAVNGQGYKELSFEVPERGRGHSPWSGDRRLPMEGPLSPLIVPSMVSPLFPLYGGCSLPALYPKRGDTYPPDHSPSWRVPFPLYLVSPWRVLYLPTI